MSRGRFSSLVLAAAITLTGAAPAPILAQQNNPTTEGLAQRAILKQYAADTWQSFKAMTNPTTGLPADHASANRVRATYTSPTNIAVYLWSTLVARDLKIITVPEAERRLRRTLGTLATLERHTDSGQFFNWYDPATGETLRRWPETGDQLYPFLSSIDNAWLASALMMITRAAPSLSSQAQGILDGMDFGCYYNATARGPNTPGLMRGGFWATADAPPYAADFPKGNYCEKGVDVTYTGHHYDILNTETRMVSYVAIALGQVPPDHYFAAWRSFPNSCGWSWQEMAAQGATRTYLGNEVFEGSYRYRGYRVVPSWGGSMFEALMPSLLVPEAQWGPRSWGRNHPNYVQAQIAHGLDDAGYGYWGFSPSQNPEEGGYREWGVDLLGMWDAGYTSDQERTSVDPGFRDLAGTGYCPGREPQPLPTYGRGVVTPHAAFLTLEFAPAAALGNLARLRRDFNAYGWGGFYDAVGVTTGSVSNTYLALDQGMIMAAIGNRLLANRLKGYFARGQVEKALRPLMAIERFSIPRTISTPRMD